MLHWRAVDSLQDKISACFDRHFRQQLRCRIPCPPMLLANVRIRRRLRSHRDADLHPFRTTPAKAAPKKLCRRMVELFPWFLRMRHRPRTATRQPHQQGLGQKRLIPGIFTADAKSDLAIATARRANAARSTHGRAVPVPARSSATIRRPGSSTTECPRRLEFLEQGGLSTSRAAGDQNEFVQEIASFSFRLQLPPTKIA